MDVKKFDIGEEPSEAGCLLALEIAEGATAALPDLPKELRGALNLLAAHRTVFSLFAALRQKKEPPKEALADWKRLVQDPDCCDPTEGNCVRVHHAIAAILDEHFPVINAATKDGSYGVRGAVLCLYAGALGCDVYMRLATGKPVGPLTRLAWRVFRDRIAGQEYIHGNDEDILKAISEQTECRDCADTAKGLLAIFPELAPDARGMAAAAMHEAWMNCPNRERNA